MAPSPKFQLYPEIVVFGSWPEPVPSKLNAVSTSWLLEGEIVNAADGDWLVTVTVCVVVLVWPKLSTIVSVTL